MTIPSTGTRVVQRRVNPVASTIPDLLELCERLSRREVAATRWSGGRSGWHVDLPEGSSELGILALKLKGLGRAPLEGEPPLPPSTVPYDRSPGQSADPHFGIRPDLEFTLVEGASSPLGGLDARSADREFVCAVELGSNGVAAAIPIAVYEYPDLVFSRSDGNVPLGVSITGSPVASPLRCTVALPQRYADPSEVANEVVRIGSVLGIDVGDGARPTTTARLVLMGECYRRFGASLAGFSRAGWYRYSGHPDNFVIGPDGRAALIDLDSCQPMAAVTPEAAALESVRDAMSGLYNLACSFFPAHVVDLIRDHELLEREPFSAFLDGWDPGGVGMHEEAGRVIAEYTVAARRRLRHFAGFLRSNTVAGDHLYRYVRHDRDLTFMLLYRIAYRCRMVRPDSLPMPFGLAELDERLLRFGGRDRMQRMIRILSGTCPSIEPI